jgi:acetylornithine deacetylase/succinyl-diaminopimelate desuccinylase-like protein
MTTPDKTRSRASDLMPELLADLERVVAIPSVAFPGYPPEPVGQMADEALRLFREAGLANAELQEVPAGYPPVYGELPGPDGAPTVMLYAHYDVQPAPLEQGWTSDPWTATRKADGRIYGRGAADDKGGLVVHLGTLRLFDGKPPCTVKLILEGMEETDSNLEAFVEANPELFAGGQRRRRRSVELCLGRRRPVRRGVPGQRRPADRRAPDRLRIGRRPPVVPPVGLGDRH